jgi:hypothetical protein
MTPIQPARQTSPNRPSPARPGDLRSRVWLEGRHARLDEVLHSIVVNALGADARVVVARDDWARVEDSIRGPVAAAVSAALDRLAADLEATLPRGIPDLARRLGDHRLRAELGYD